MANICPKHFVDDFLTAGRDKFQYIYMNGIYITILTL